MIMNIVYPLDDYPNHVFEIPDDVLKMFSLSPKTHKDIVILDEENDTYRVSIAYSGVVFNISKNKCLIQENTQDHPLAAWGFS